MKYFDHDTSASDDDAIMALRLEHGGAAIDCYWALLEKMYREERPINLFGTEWETNMETRSVSHRLCIGYETLKTYVSTMLEIGLLDGTPENVYSKRAMLNITSYQQKCETARQNGKKGGRKPTSKPKKNRVGFNVATDAETTSALIKEKKDIGFDKQNLYLKKDASDGAATGETAPPSAQKSTVPKCPLCSSSVTFSARSQKWECDVCGEIKEPRFEEVGA